MPTKLTNEILIAALAGFEVQKTRIDQRMAELKAILSGDSTQSTPAAVPPQRKPRKMSAAARARIAEAQRKRWANLRGESDPPAPAAPKAKRRLSAAGRRAIIAATKRRWALKRAEAVKAPAAAKKAPVKKAAGKAPKVKTAKRAASKKKANNLAAKKTAPPAAPAAPETSA
jgi:1,4-alpha-glucan branching enzyme